MERIITERGLPDHLINNAGGQFVSMMEDISANGFDAVVRSNLTGGFIVAREVFKQSMRDNVERTPWLNEPKS